MFIKQNKNLKEKFGVLQKKVLSFGPNRTVEVRPNSSAKLNVRSVTTSCIDPLSTLDPT